MARPGILETSSAFMPTLLVLVIFTLIIFQAIGLTIGQAFGFNIALGPVFVLIPLALASLMSIIVLKRLIQGMPVTKQDIFAIIIVTIIALVVLFTLRDMVPEVFRASFVELERSLNLG